MANLLAETIIVLETFGKLSSDVLWVGNLSFKAAGTWEDFEKLANFDYNEGYGGNEISSNLVIVGNDWWLSRGEYDGSEWWNFNTQPIKPETSHPLRLEDLQEN